MLKTISIESLFDIYSYTLDIKPDEVPLRFITGPNGYGKTTILNILNALYTSKIRELAVIPYWLSFNFLWKQDAEKCCRIGKVFEIEGVSTPLCLHFLHMSK